MESAELMIEDLLREANDSITGENGSFIDHNMAEEKLQTATKLGSAGAYFRLGLLYGDPDGELYNTKKSLLMLNMALKHGHSRPLCFAQMASIYAANGDRRNAKIAYEKSFNDRELIDAIQEQLSYESAHALIAEESDGEEDEFFTAAREELGNSEFFPENQEEPGEVLVRESMLISAAMSMCLYFSYVGSEAAEPILSDSVLQLFPVTKNYAENNLADSPETYEIFELGVKRYAAAFELDDLG